MSTWLRGALALLLVGALGGACTAPGEPVAAPTTTRTVTQTQTASPVTVTPSPVTVTETAEPPPSAPQPVATSAPGGSSPALGALESLPVKGRAPKTGYDRAQFGQAWSDAVGVDGGRNGCDSRIICSTEAIGNCLP